MRLYGITDEYINYIRKEFPRVYSNKEDTRIHMRKYLGAVIEINGYKYYIPLSSPKENHDYIVENGKKTIRKSSLIVIRIIEGEGERAELKGTLQIGTMIPVPESELIEYDVNSEIDQKYKDLIWSELEFIRKHEAKIIKNAKILYTKKAKGSEEKVVQNCLDFHGVEKACDTWIKNKKKRKNEGQ